MIQDRQQAIMNALSRRPRLAFDRLRSELGVSRSTLRRDLMELENLGKVIRVRGHVLCAGRATGEPGYDTRRSLNLQAKRCVGESAAGLVPAGASVYVDAGTTCMEAGRKLMARGDVQIFTNSLRLLQRAVAVGAPVICVGGTLRPVSEALVGGLASPWLAHLRFDWCVLGASGLDAGGASTTDLIEAEFKQIVVSRSHHVVVAADASKWGAPSTVCFATWEQTGYWVTDSRPAGMSRRAMKSTKVVIAT